MGSDYKNLFTATQNFALLREKLGEYKKLPSEDELAKFLVFFDDVYKLWKKENPSNSRRYEEKAKARREFTDMLGTRQ
ncbi:MAG: hypothetical protein R6W90_12270 [Ignavibacteriaceae bacterium]